MSIKVLGFLIDCDSEGVCNCCPDEARCDSDPKAADSIGFVEGSCAVKKPTIWDIFRFSVFSGCNLKYSLDNVLRIRK